VKTAPCHLYSCSVMVLEIEIFHTKKSNKNLQTTYI